MTTVIQLPWSKPPIRSNGSRGGHHAHAALVKTVRSLAGTIGSNHLKLHGPLPHPCHVMLVWTVTDNIQRDAMNLAWAMKPIADGFVDAHLWPADHSKIITRSSQEVRQGETESLTIEIEEA